LEKGGRSGGPPAEIALRVGLVHAGADSAVASKLGSLLQESGAEIVAAGAAPPADGLVVLMSKDTFAEPGLLPAREAAEMTRVIPVRIGRLNEDSVPEHLRELNWIDWAPEHPATTLGFIVAGLLSDPSRYRLSRQLEHEAASWDSAGRRAEQLIGDRRRARRMRDLLTELAADPIASPDEVTVEFIAASDKATRKVQRRRRIARGAAAFAAITAFSVAVTAIPRIQANARISRAAIVTAGNEVILDQMPEWSAANAAALMLEGTSVQQELGRSTLLQAMVRPWEISDASFIDSVITAAPYDHGEKGAVLALAPGGSGLAIVDLRAGLTLATGHLPRRFEALDVSPDGRFAAVAGHGAATIDLRSGRIRSLTSRGSYAGIRVLGGRVALWTDGGRLELRDAHGGGVHPVGDYESVLDVVADGRGGGSALVAEGPGDYAIVDLGSGAIVARGRVEPGDGIGALSPDGRRAVVDGGDDQFWLFGRGRPQPTGIAVPVYLTDLEWASRERLLIASDSERGEVVFIPRAERLGRVCAIAPSVSGVRVEPGGETVACAGDARSFWRLPPAPSESPAQVSATPPRSATSPYARIAIRGRRGRIMRRGPLGSYATGWTEPFDSSITAAAFSPVSHQVALGSARGSILVTGLTRTGTRAIVTWKAPDRSPIVALHWKKKLTASTASGQTWSIPSCLRCETDAGLIAAARARFSGCFTARQMEWIDSDVRQRLGLRECEPIFVIPRG
jgi:hypothetical protein